jgi:hypothetical protein
VTEARRCQEGFAGRDWATTGTRAEWCLMYPCMWPFVVTALGPSGKPTNLASFRHFAFSGRYKYPRISPTPQARPLHTKS